MMLQDFVIRALCAAIIGGIIGFERQWRNKMAGIRTNVLVALGSFLFVTLSMIIEGESSPTRISAQIVSGIGFLGGGVIIRDGLNVRGLNTAATLWCSAAAGVLSSAGLILEAFIGSVLVLLVNIILRYVPRRLEKWRAKDFSEENWEKPELFTLLVNWEQKGKAPISGLVQEIEANGLQVQELNLKKGSSEKEIEIKVANGLKEPGLGPLLQLIESLAGVTAVNSFYPERIETKAV